MPSKIDPDQKVDFENSKRCNTLSFRNVCYSVKVSEKTRKCFNKKIKRLILKDVQGCAKSGELTAVLGPSGAGKTTLLNTLTFTNSGGSPTGEVYINSTKFTENIFRQNAVYVGQEFRLWSYLTVHETCAFAAELYVSDEALKVGETRDERVTEIVRQMGLQSCKDTLVGNHFLRGLSGGQKRRLTIGVDLLKRPMICFLDEPTSGLDALAEKENIIMFATIHAPSSRVYLGINHVIMLADGKVAYRGSPSDTMNYCEIIGRKGPSNLNPAEYFIELINKDFTDPSVVEDTVDAWNKYSIENNLERTNDNYEYDTTVVKPNTSNVSLCRQVFTLTRRRWLLVKRDPMVYLGRAIGFIFLMTFFAIVYLSSRDRKQSQILNKMWVLLWHVGVPCQLACVAVHSYNSEGRILQQEIKNGMCSAMAYIISNIIIEFPMMLVLALSSCGISGYGIGNWNENSLLKAFLIFAALLWSFECVAQALAITFHNPILGMMQFMNFWFASFLFGGIMIGRDDIIWPLRIFCYITPHTYGLRTLINLEFLDRTYEGAVPCNPSEPNCNTVAGAAGGYRCSKSVKYCYGYTGEQVLQNLGFNYQTVSSEDKYFEDLCMILMLAISFKLLFVINMLLLCRSEAALEAPIELKSVKSL